MRLKIIAWIVAIVKMVLVQVYEVLTSSTWLVFMSAVFMAKGIYLKSTAMIAHCFIFMFFALLAKIAEEIAKCKKTS